MPCESFFIVFFCPGFDGDGPDTCRAAHAYPPAAAYCNGHTGEVSKIIALSTKHC